MILTAHMRNRRDEIESYFKLLEFMTNIESHKQIPLHDPTNPSTIVVTQEMQCCLKSQLILMLYNMVESTVCLCLNSIYDEIHDCGLTYSEITDSMRSVWIDSCKRAGMPEKDFDESSKMGLIVIFKEIAVNTSGNLDIRKIYEIFDKHGCSLDETLRDKYSESFLTVKSKRNLLAHGNTSFCKCGSLFVLRNLEKLKNDVFDFMTLVVAKTSEFIDNKSFIRA